jgi:hypothetical protein
MRGFGVGLAVLALGFGVVVSCGGSDDGDASGNDAGSAGQSISGSGGAASAGKAGGASGGSSAGTSSTGASGSASGGANAGTSAGGNPVAGAPAEAGAPGAGGSALFDCDPKNVTCKIAVPDCPAFEVPVVDGTCWGDCVKIAQCACSEANDCPNENEYTCWSKQHCGPYLL